MKIYKLIYLSIVLSTNVHASPVDYIKSVHINGHEINAKEIKRISTTSEGFIDQLELKHDLIYYGSEVEKVLVKIKDTEISIPSNLLFMPASSNHLIRNGHLFNKLEGDGSGGG